jgi:glycosyltransferase involved in cell wall biosynthesis
MNPRVSVALCTHNGAGFIAEQFESILKQSHSVDEIVVSDDASTDDTVQRVAAVHATYRSTGRAPELRILINDEALGVAANFEQALTACTGDILFLSDQDDVWHADRVSSVLPIFHDDDRIRLVHANARIVDDFGVAQGSDLFSALEFGEADRNLERSSSAFDLLVKRNVVTGAATAITAELRDAALPVPPSWLHDEWLAIVAALTGRIGVIDAPLIDYRIHGANQVGVVIPSLRGKIARVLAPRGDRNAVLAARAAELVERAPSMRPELVTTITARIEQKALHERIRADLPQSRLARILPVLKEWRTGRYSMFASQGKLDIARDLLQPAR